MPAPAITFTLDLEDHRPSDRAELRYPMLTRRLLDQLDDIGVTGTVFVVGEVAADQPGLVREVAERGHEVALHGLYHRPLTELSPEAFAEDLRVGKARLEDLVERPVEGFRAPMFSLVRDSRWAVEILRDAGFAYSSSVLPARSPLFGDPQAPPRPFRWPNGLPELPCPVARVGPGKVPFLGGVYLRALPWAVVRAHLARRNDDDLLWIYCHPYDFDPDEPYWVVPEAGRIGSRLLWYGRRRAFARVRSLLAGRAGGPLGLRAAALSADLPEWRPPTGDPDGSRTS
jgi:polysaccharide deacetylase family protein (PEP-CTERM system associated)